MQDTNERVEKVLRAMSTLSLPPFTPHIREIEGKMCIFDRLRRKYVALTPEEWVRQHFVNFLISQKGYPPTLLANEVALQVNDKTLRADTVVYNSQKHTTMLIEYKAPSVTINNKVLEQAMAYNTLLKVDFLVVSNGIVHYCCKVDYSSHHCLFLDDIPDYETIK